MDRDMMHITNQLDLALLAIDAGNPELAINCLAQARFIARQGNTQRAKVIATHCTAAIEALLPVSLEGML